MPEVIKNNMDILKERNIVFLNPFISLDNDKKLIMRLVDELANFKIDKKEISMAVETCMD